MPARAIWQGVITFKGVELPVKLYSAVVDRDVHFHLLHETDGARLQQRMVNPATGAFVERDDVRKGYPIGEGRFVLIDDAELARIEPKPSRTIEVMRFVPADGIELEWYDRPYFLGPTAGSTSEYAAFAQALNRRGSRGIVRWVMRKKEYVGALCAEGRYLYVVTLFNRGETVPIEQLDAPKGRDLLKEERLLAERLIHSLEGNFDPADYRDTYQERVHELVEAKRHGKKPKARRVRASRPAASSLTESLRMSLEHAGRRAH